MAVPGALRWLMGEVFFAGWDYRHWIDARKAAFPGEPDREADTVARFDRRAGDAPSLALVVEFLSRPRADVLERLAEYQLAIRRTIPLQREPLVKYDVVGLLVNLTGEQSDEWKMAPPDAVGAGMGLKVIAVSLPARPAADALNGITSGAASPAVLALVPLMIDGEKADVVARWVDLASGLADEGLKAD